MRSQEPLNILKSQGMFICLGKSTYTRCGIIINVIAEPGGKDMLLLSFLTQQIYQQFMLENCANVILNLMKNVKQVIKIEVVNIRAKLELLYPKLSNSINCSF